MQLPKPSKLIGQVHMNNNIIKSWNDRAIRIRADRYVSLTDMAQATDKLFGHWNENKKTHSYLTALSGVIGIPITGLVQAIQGGDPQDQGTWGHPKVALRFAQWCMGIGCNNNNTVI